MAAGVAGAALGGLIGNRIGAAMDDEDKQRAYYAQMDALEERLQRCADGRGAIRIRSAAERSFRGRNMTAARARQPSVDLHATRSISMVGRKSRAVRVPATPMAAGHRSATHCSPWSTRFYHTSGITWDKGARRLGCKRVECMRMSGGPSLFERLQQGLLGSQSRCTALC